LSLRCHTLNGHRRWDIASLGLSTCRQEDKCFCQTWRLRLLFGAKRT
jgi:hypothetical protein